MSVPQGLTRRWRKGGMTSNGLRAAGEVWDYTYGPGRSNIIPDATPKRTFSFNDPVSSIGVYQTRGTKQIAASTYGPGTLPSSNVEVSTQNIQSEYSHGKQRQNYKKTQYVDYRSTDPSLIQNLRNNPLSIYATGEAKKNAPIPAFESYVRPDHYNNITSVVPKIDSSTKQMAIDGSPQTNILGLAKENPFLGLVPKSEEKPIFMGKTYGGKDGSARPFALSLYSTAWKTNQEVPLDPQIDNVYPQFKREHFNAPRKGGCKNDALMHFSPGFNITDQVNQGKMSTWVANDKHTVNNLPWGPQKRTQNPQTQEQGIWQRGANPWPTKNTQTGYRNNPTSSGVKPHIPPIQNCYRHGDNESLVCN